MALREINRKIVIQKDNNLQHRFYQDFSAKISLNCWLSKEDEHAGDFTIVEKFHLGKRAYVFEWFKGHGLSYCELDDGYNDMKVKRSPIMIAGTAWSESRFEEMSRYFREYPENNDDAVNFVKNLVLGHVHAN